LCISKTVCKYTYNILKKIVIVRHFLVHLGCYTTTGSFIKNRDLFLILLGAGKFKGLHLGRA
jgi:hypothetical protein